MKKFFTLALLLAILSSAYSQTTETNDLITYDTTYNGTLGSWMIRITRPRNMFTAGNADTDVAVARKRERPALRNAVSRLHKLIPELLIRR